MTPKGTDDEKARLAQAGKPYERPAEQRERPALPTSPAWPDVLQRAFLANGDLEASYFEWKAAFERIEVASAYPNSRLMVGYSYMFSGGNMKAFDRSTFAFSPDAMQNLMLPSKVKQQGLVALDEARTAGARFRAAKFDLQKRVLSAWADYSVAAERARIEHERQGLAQLAVEAARSRVVGGGPQQDLLKAELGMQTAEDAVRRSEAELTAARAALNGMLARGPGEPLDPPARMPPPRPIPADDAALLATAVEQNPELDALARQVEGRGDALELARMQWLPDINPTFMFTGSVSQAAGATIVLPTTIKQIQGEIREAGAMVRGAEATLRQASRDRAGSFVATLVMLRDAERQAALFETRIIPAADGVLTSTRQRYTTGGAMYLDMIDAQQMLLDARLTLAEARASREKRLAELEALMGTDVETLAPSSPGSSKETSIRAAAIAERPVKESRHD